MPQRVAVSIALATILVLPGALLAAGPGVVINSPAGVPLSKVVAAPISPTRPPLTPEQQIIDTHCCGPDTLDWGLNDTFYWATAFSTDLITEPYRVTEVRWTADGGETEEYWIAPDGGGFPDTSQAQYLGTQSVPDTGGVFQFQTFGTVAAAAVVQPGQLYWFIRASNPLGGFGFALTWRSSTNLTPDIQDPVSISQNFDSGWSPWVTGLNWQMEYEIVGAPAADFPNVSLTGSCPGAATLSISGVTPSGKVALLRGTAEGASVVPAGSCAGTPLGLADPSPLRVLTVDGNGELTANPNLPMGACGAYLQILDLTSCVPSAVVQVP